MHYRLFRFKSYEKIYETKEYKNNIKKIQFVKMIFFNNFYMKLKKREKD